MLSEILSCLVIVLNKDTKTRLSLKVETFPNVYKVLALKCWKHLEA